MRIECKARDLATAIDAAWQRERQEATCPECDGSRLSEDRTICWDCQASDYLEEERK
jgi:ribosomal protein L37AE/L43A